ncbi:unnamed protein product, partial [Phaeothamnion confervicola]
LFVSRRSQVTARLPATLWSQQVLAQRRRWGSWPPANDFEAKAVLAYLRACGVPAGYSTAFGSLEIVHTFTLL